MIEMWDLIRVWRATRCSGGQLRFHVIDLCSGWCWKVHEGRGLVLAFSALPDVKHLRLGWDDVEEILMSGRLGTVGMVDPRMSWLYRVLQGVQLGMSISTDSKRWRRSFGFVTNLTLTIPEDIAVADAESGLDRGCTLEIRFRLRLACKSLEGAFLTKADDELWSQQECQTMKEWSDDLMEGLVYGNGPLEMVGLMGEKEACKKVLSFLNHPECDLFGWATKLEYHPGRGAAYDFYGCSHHG